MKAVDVVIAGELFADLTMIALLGSLYILVATGLAYIAAGLRLLIFGVLAYLWRARRTGERPFEVAEGAAG